MIYSCLWFLILDFLLDYNDLLFYYWQLVILLSFNWLLQKDIIYPKPFELQLIVMVQFSITMTIIILEVTHIKIILILQFTKSTFFIILILSFVWYSFFSILKISLSMFQMIHKVTFIIVAICPKIFSFTIWTIFSIFSYICLSIMESFRS